MKVYLIAGEPSGDALGARLMRAMRLKTEDKVEFFGVGGEAMEAEGLNSIFDISDLAVMGFLEVVPSIPKILKLIKRTIEDVQDIKPDVVVTIDSWSFSSRIHKKLRKLKLGIPQVHYVAPQVWAWKKKRAKTMYKYIDKLLTLLPQEPKYFTPYNLDAVFVGHPVIESKIFEGNGEAFRKKYGFDENKKLVGVLPGSRHNEVVRLLPVFIETAEKLVEADKNIEFVIPTVRTVAKRVKDMVGTGSLPITIVEDVNDRHDAFNALDAAMAASGTVSLELAIANVPHIIAYKVSPLSAAIARRFLKIQFVNLVNILLGREVVPELIQERAVAGNIEKHIKALLKHEDLYEKEIAGFSKVKEILGMGREAPSERAAVEVIESVAGYNKYSKEA